MAATAPSFLAFDLGAESGRAVLGSIHNDRLVLEELHRFANSPVHIANSLYWDILHQWSELQTGLAKAAASAGDSLLSAGVDTWGVDYGLLAADDTLLGNPYHYRDSRTDGMVEAAFQVVPREEIYERTGVQFIQLNSLFQLYSMVKTNSPALKAASTFLNIPDLLNFWLTGEKASEFTIATTTQCYDPRAGTWANDMLDKLGIPPALFPKILQPGQILGKLRPAVSRDNNTPPIPVVAVASHDTGSAVAAVPAEGRDYIYLSSGTWSLMGVELDQAIINPDTLKYNFTNEGGVLGTIRFLKNIMGLWLVQECRRQWERSGEKFSYDDLTALAASAPAFGALVSPTDLRFLPPGGMIERIQGYCKETSQPIPHSKGEIVRCVLESLALEYRWVAEKLEMLVGRRLPTIHIIGGGSRNKLLNQFAANATGCRVIAGPVEATAIGNILMQAVTMGQLGSLSQARALVRRSFDVTTFEPHDPARWDEQYQRYLTIRK
jgi:rhamnulokinase